MANILKTTKFDYYNSENILSYSKIRTDFDDGSKKFKFEQPDGTKSMNGKEHLLYNLPSVIKSDVVYFVEGEKCANAIIELGYTATTLDCGARSTWCPEYTESLKNKNVIILPDNDTPGIKYAQSIKKNIPWAIIKKLPGLKKKEDVFDWLQKGHSISEIDSLPENTDFSGDSENSSDKFTQSESLLSFIKKENIELFLNENHDPYAEILAEGHKELLSIDSNDFSLWAQHLYYKRTGKTIRQENLKQAICILKAETKFGNKSCVTLYNRVAKHDTCFGMTLQINRGMSSKYPKTDGLQKTERLNCFADTDINSHK